MCIRDSLLSVLGHSLQPGGHFRLRQWFAKECGLLPCECIALRRVGYVGPLPFVECRPVVMPSSSARYALTSLVHGVLSGRGPLRTVTSCCLKLVEIRACLDVVGLERLDVVRDLLDGLVQASDGFVQGVDAVQGGQAVS